MPKVGPGSYESGPLSFYSMCANQKKESVTCLPYCKDVIQPKLLRRTRNTSLILPAVINKIAELKDISSNEVEQTTAENTIQLFKLPINT